MTLFSGERRRKERKRRMATVVFTVKTGKKPVRVSSPVTATARDFSNGGMSVVTPKISPDGIHVMYDTLMTTRNHVDATIFPEGQSPIRVSGKVVWFRAVENPEGAYIFGMQFDEASEDLKEWLYLE
ncbi:MAG: PilZ domain-containing protein [Thermodesulfobacteriota bacterium]|nr:PilZ domain-containing protein [Thermodesulfobacteriota bacterium]